MEEDLPRWIAILHEGTRNIVVNKSMHNAPACEYGNEYDIQWVPVLPQEAQEEPLGTARLSCRQIWL